MAKQQQTKSGTSRIRFIMLEAEIPEGDLNQITTAIQNALKPATVVQNRPSIAISSGPGAVSQEAEPETIETDDFEEMAESAKPARQPRSARTRKPTAPDVIEADFDSPVSLQAFASEHSAKNETERNLIIAAWFKEHRDVSAVTASHVYTGYRLLGWPSGIEDFSWPLRALKKNKLMTSPAQGEYAINHLGLDRVRKLRG